MQSIVECEATLEEERAATWAVRNVTADLEADLSRANAHLEQTEVPHMFSYLHCYNDLDL